MNIEELRKKVSLDLETDLVSLRDSLLEQSFEKIDLTHIQWPHQSPRDAIMGHIFFPLQFEYLYESPSALILRVHMQRCLAISASYGNTLAQTLMKDVFDMYRGKNAKFLDYFGLKADRQLASYSDSMDIDPVVHKVPCYFGGLLSPGSPLSKGYFQKGWEIYKDIRCGEYYISSLRENLAEATRVWEEISEIDPGLGLILKQRYFVKDRAERMSLALQAATQYGVKEGYYIAGLLGMEDRDFLLDCFLKAAEPSKDRPGRPWLYRDIARVHLTRDRKKAAASYIRGAQLGDTIGYLKAAEIYSQDGEERAKEFFEKAVNSCSYEPLYEINDEYTKRAEEVWGETYRELVSLAKIE